MDMVAPRALLETGNTDYYWLTNRANYVSARATQLVYNAFGIGDRFGFYIDGKHPHCQTLPAEAPAITAFVNRFMRGKTSEQSDVEVNPFPSLDYKRWTAWWGIRPKGEPEFPNAWVAASIFVLPLNPAHLKIHAGDPVQAAYQLMIPGSHADATATLVNGNVQADIRCGDGSSYTLNVPLTANQSYSIPFNSNQWVSNSGGPQGSVKAAACGATTGHGVLQSAYFSSLGVSPGNAKSGGPGFTTTDATDPLDVEFSCSANGESTASSTPVNVNTQQ